jgi:hypothetical protein
MNPVTRIPAQSPATISPEITAFLILPSLKARRIDVAARDPAEAAAEVAGSVPHQSKFVLVVSDPRTGGTLTHWYAVKRKSKARWVVVDHITRAVHDTYPEHLFSLETEAFAPAEPWVWVAGADVVGRRGDLVEQGVSR